MGVEASYNRFMAHGYPKNQRFVVGVDLDNTIVRYDGLLRRMAMEEGYMTPGHALNKRMMRDSIRLLDDGESKWQHLQAKMYGPRMEEAEIAPGFEDFLARRQELGVEIHIVSHKTRFAFAAPDGPDLHETARTWLRKRGILRESGGIPETSLHFEISRADKIARIVSLKCACFIDDLVETFLEPDFPTDIRKLLYAPEDTPVQGDWMTLDHWNSIAGVVKRMIRNG